MKKGILLLVLFACVFDSGIAQNTSLQNQIISKLEEQTSNNSYPEKVYIQTDKPYYFLDENIWFTAYLVNGVTHTKSEKSRVVYVELINDKDQILDKKILDAKHTSCAGDFKISKKWKTGKYLIRAYTNAMRNSSPDFFFQKEILVSALKEKKSKKIKKSKTESKAIHVNSENAILPRPVLGFYPEGGNLVDGLKNKVAVKVKDSIFNNIELSGIVYDNENTKITTFKTADVGLGFFYLTPSPDKTYYVSIDINGAEERYDLPKSLSKGFVLNANQKKGTLLIDLKSTVSSGLKNTLLVVHQRGQMLFNKIETSDKNRSVFSIDSSKLQNGIVHITLFNADENPVCERLLFIDNPANHIKVDIKQKKKILKKRKKVSLQLDITNLNGKKLPSNLSLAVRDLEAIPYNKRTGNIKTWLLLNSDLKGSIKNPGYYFEKENDRKRAFLLDLVMLTNGWRRFKWTSILDKENDSLKFSTEKGLYLKGRAVRVLRQKKAAPSLTRMSFMGNIAYQEEKRTDANGRFEYGPFVFYDSDSLATVIEASYTDFKTKNFMDRQIQILVDEPIESPDISKNVILKPTVNEKTFASFLKVSRYMQEIQFQNDKSRQLLDEVVIKARKKKQKDEREIFMNEQTSHGTPTRRLVTEDILNAEGMTSMELLSQIPGVFVVNEKITIRNREPRFIFDELPVDLDYIKSIPTSEIGFVDVLLGSEANMYNNANNGIIALYSPRGRINRIKITSSKPGIIDLKPKGFYTAKEFYAPDHINGIEESMQRDIRTTLHWAPIIRTSKDLAPILTFFTCDKAGDYIIELEGITDTGIPIHATSTFVVE